MNYSTLPAVEAIRNGDKEYVIRELSLRGVIELGKIIIKAPDEGKTVPELMAEVVEYAAKIPQDEYLDLPASLAAEIYGAVLRVNNLSKILEKKIPGLAQQSQNPTEPTTP